MFFNSWFPFPGIVGEIGESKDEYYIWTHKKLDISYNNDQIVDVSLTSESKAKLTPNTKISFTYEVHVLKHLVAMLVAFVRPANVHLHCTCMHAQ